MEKTRSNVVREHRGQDLLEGVSIKTKLGTSNPFYEEGTSLPLRSMPKVQVESHIKAQLVQLTHSIQNSQNKMQDLLLFMLQTPHFIQPI